MIVINPNTTNKRLTFIPRRYSVIVDVIFRNENTDVKETISFVPIISNGKMTIETNKTFQEGDCYEIEVNDIQGNIFRGKVFVTSQTDLENYKINTDIIRYE